VHIPMLMFMPCTILLRRYSEHRLALGPPTASTNAVEALMKIPRGPSVNEYLGYPDVLLNHGRKVRVVTFTKNLSEAFIETNVSIKKRKTLESCQFG
jgi:hypothetical protein